MRTLFNLMSAAGVFGLAALMSWLGGPAAGFQWWGWADKKLTALLSR